MKFLELMVGGEQFIDNDNALRLKVICKKTMHFPLKNLIQKARHFAPNVYIRKTTHFALRLYI